MACARARNKFKKTRVGASVPIPNIDLSETDVVTITPIVTNGFTGEDFFTDRSVDRRWKRHSIRDMIDEND